MLTQKNSEPSNILDLNPGDVVVLKSGGPKMTVDFVFNVEKPGNPRWVCCTWFEGGTRQSGDFSIRVLERFMAGRVD